MDAVRRWTRPFLVGLLIWVAIGIPAALQAETLLQTVEREIASLLEANRSCVVRIHTIYSQARQDGDLEYGTGFTHGTGFLFDPAGYVLTVEKAVAGARSIRVTLGSGETRDARFVASDPQSDVAVIQIDGEGLPCVKPGDSDRVRVGHYSFILGNAFGNLVPSIGSVYEVNGDQDLIQIATTVHPSFGGAPVFDSSGNVLGMVWAAPSHATPALGELVPGLLEVATTVYVIPMKRAERIARTLIREGEMNYGWLGVQVDEETLPVVVANVSPGGPAARAGLEPGDQILRYNGKPVAGPHHLRRLVMETPPGTSVSIRVKRGSEAMATAVQVAERASSDEEEAARTRIEGLESELGGLRRMLGLDRSEPAAMNRSAKPVGIEETRHIYEQIDSVERELARLKQMFQRP